MSIDLLRVRRSVQRRRRGVPANNPARGGLGAALATALALTTGCGGDDGAAPTDAAVDAFAFPIEEGVYQGSIVRFQTDTCGDFTDAFEASATTVTYGTGRDLTLSQPAGAMHACTVAAGAINCGTAREVTPVGPDLVFTLDYSAFAATPVARTAYDYTQDVGIACAGSGCAAVGTFPCMLKPDVHYAK